MIQAPQTAQLLRAAIGQFESGHLEEARQRCHQVLRLEPVNADAHHTLGVIELRSGHRDAAVVQISRAIALDPSKSEYHNSMGAIFAEGKDHARAIHHFWQALALRPDSSDALRNLARCLFNIEYFDEAARTLERAVKLHPNDHTFLLQLARSLLRAGRRDAAKEHFQRALTLKPDQPEALFELGRILLDEEQPDEAANCFRQATAAKPDYAAAHASLALALDRAGRSTEAIEQCRHVLKLNPTSAEMLKNLGILLHHRGKTEEAERQLVSAIDNSPEFVESYLALGQFAHLTKYPKQWERLRALGQNDSLPPRDRAIVQFAIGKAYEDTGDCDTAFAHYQRGNVIQRQQVNYDRKNTDTQVGALCDYFTEATFTELAGRFAVESEVPMFVVGMPRSGTTLVEQILSSHPSIHGAGELPDLRRIMFAMPKAAQTATSFPYCMASLDGTVGRDTAGQYLDKLISFAPDALRITDKMPWNVFVLGMIALFYPKARVIHCRRDPMDTCVSCYTQCFAANQPFSWDLADLGDYYRQYDRLTEHWRRVLPVQVFEVQYERLVEAPQEVVRELIDFSGLPWDDACLEFHRSKRPTRTNPTQVRQPIYKTSIDRWRCYESHLEPLRRALAGDLTDG